MAIDRGPRIIIDFARVCINLRISSVTPLSLLACAINNRYNKNYKRFMIDDSRSEDD